MLELDDYTHYIYEANDTIKDGLDKLKELFTGVIKNRI